MSLMTAILFLRAELLLASGECSGSPQFASHDLSNLGLHVQPPKKAVSAQFLELVFVERSNSKNSNANAFARSWLKFQSEYFLNFVFSVKNLATVCHFQELLLDSKENPLIILKTFTNCNPLQNLVTYRLHLWEEF